MAIYKNAYPRISTCCSRYLYWEKFSGINKIPYTLGFGVWREESTANALTLMIIKRTDNKEFYTYAKDFMKTQPKAYRLGILMEDFGYETFISVMRNKIEGVRPKLKKHGSRM